MRPETTYPVCSWGWVCIGTMVPGSSVTSISIILSPAVSVRRTMPGSISTGLGASCLVKGIWPSSVQVQVKKGGVCGNGVVGVGRDENAVIEGFRRQDALVLVEAFDYGCVRAAVDRHKQTPAVRGGLCRCERANGGESGFLKHRGHGFERLLDSLPELLCLVGQDPGDMNELGHWTFLPTALSSSGYNGGGRRVEG